MRRLVKISKDAWIGYVRDWPSSLAIWIGSFAVIGTAHWLDGKPVNMAAMGYIVGGSVGMAIMIVPYGREIGRLKFELWHARMRLREQDKMLAEYENNIRKWAEENEPGQSNIPKLH